MTSRAVREPLFLTRPDSLTVPFALAVVDWPVSVSAGAVHGDTRVRTA